MATYYIVADGTSPLGPNEIEAGSGILANDGDVFIVTAGADKDIKFGTSGGSPTNISIEFNESNSNGFTVAISGSLDVDFTIADDVVLDSLAINAEGAELVTLTAGDNVTLDKYSGSKAGVDTVVLGDNFTTNNDFKTEGGDDTLSVGENFTGSKIDMGDDFDTVTTQDPDAEIVNAEVILTPDGIVQGTAGDDVMNVGYTDIQSDSIDGDDNTVIGYAGNDTINGGDGADTIYGDYDTAYQAPPDVAAGAEELSFAIDNADLNNGEVKVEIDNLGDKDLANDILITDTTTDPITELSVEKMGDNDGEADVFRIDLSTFDDDFAIVTANESVEDVYYLIGVETSLDNGDGTFTFTYIGSDDAIHTVTVDPGDASIQTYQSLLDGSDFADTIDGGAGNDAIDGGFGDDDLTGGTGTDTIYGGSGADTIDGGTGDDIIYGGGGVTADAAPDGADIIDGGEGNDTIDAGAGADQITGGIGDDTIYAGEGDDTVNAGEGADTIYGDGNGAPPAATSEFLDWSAEGADEADLSAGFTQNTGTMDVSVSFVDDGTNTPTYTVESTDTIYVAGGEPFDTNSSVHLWGDGNADTSTTIIDFAAATGSGMTDEVDNLQFRISDIDSAAGNHQDEITITALDANGDPVVVTITPAGDDTVSGQTVTGGAAGDNSGDANGSVLVTFAGPVSYVEIDYNNLDTGTQAIWVSDMHFDTIPDVSAGGGDDDISGDAGDDIIHVSEGTDTIDGGADSDTYTAEAFDDGSIDATIAQDGSGTVDKSAPGTTDTITSVERFVADEEVGQTDSIELTGNVDRNFISGLSDDAVGFFTPDNGDPVIFFGGTGEPTINELLAGTYDPGTGPVSMVGTYSITGGEEDGAQIGNIYTENFEEITFNAVCFVRGTQIETEDGAVPVERLAVGDMVMTLDHGPQPLRWIGSTKATALGHLAPIRIAAGALNNTEDLWVSPQHRMLLRDWRLELLFAEMECLVTAKSLVNGSTIRPVEGGQVEYFHMMFDAREIVFAEGAPSESFYPGPVGLRNLSRNALDGLHTAFPGLTRVMTHYGPPARMALREYEARLLATDPSFIPQDAEAPRIAA